MSTLTVAEPASVQQENATSIHETVRKHYRQRAQAQDSCCAASSCCNTSTRNGYSTEELSSIPDDADLGLGCGNPTALASLKEGEVVLDLGSGGGIDVLLSAQRVGATGFVYGVDMTDEMLSLARRNLEKAGLSNVEFRKGQIEELPISDQTIDVILSNCVINLSPDKRQVLSEAFRVLRPGGRVAISDIVVDGTLNDLPVSEAQIRKALSWAGCVAGALTVNDYQEILTEIGFERIEISIRTHYTLEALGQDMKAASLLKLAPEVIHNLVSRFASANISAYRA
ncbi:arsenite methyltransferase [Chloroflexi bacterium TSY]|nr:arsenite methyltransferase [Chloroflexi bacterium TSY]